MNAAMAHARATLPQFIAVVQHPKRGRTLVGLKVKFRSGTWVEHMWIDRLTYSNHVFHGRLVNTPQWITGAKWGDPITAREKDVSDWMYVENGKLVGGFTERVFRKRETPAQRAADDKANGYKID